MSTPAGLCDPFAALLLDHRQRFAAAQADPEETMGPNQTSTDKLPLSSPSCALDPRLPPPFLPLESANKLTHPLSSSHPVRSSQPIKASFSASGPHITNVNDHENHTSNQDVQAGTTSIMSQHIIEPLHKFIQEERIRNFNFLGMSSHRYMKQDELLVVSSATHQDVQDVKTRCPALRTYRDTAWFTFHQLATYGTSNPTVVVTVPGGSAISVDNMVVLEPHIRGGFSITPAIAWMRDKYNCEDARAMNLSENQYEEQFMWWSGTGKAFPLLNLPAELRDAIYLQVLGPVMLLDLHASQTVFGRGLSYKRACGSQKFRDPDIEAPSMSIMRVNRQVKTEVSQVAARDCQKRLRMVGRDGRDTARRGPLRPGTRIARRWLSSAPQPGFLSKLQLEMSAAASFESIGIKPTLSNPLARVKGGFSLSDLRHFTALRELDFRFVSPKHEDAVCPWAVVSATHKNGEHSCQKLWIDWYFTLAWKVLKYLRLNNTSIRYTLSGCVKTSSKQYWDRILNASDDRDAQTIKAAETRIREQKTDSLPIACRCSTPCSKAGAERTGKQYTWSEHELDKIVGLQEHIDDIYWSFKD